MITSMFILIGYDNKCVSNRTTEYVQTSFNSTEFNLIGSNYNYTCSGRVCWVIIKCSYSSKIGSDCRILIVLNGSD